MKLYLAGLAAVPILTAIALVVIWTGNAHCEDDCPNVGCNEEMPCPGDCGCVRRPGQPFGTCASF